MCALHAWSWAFSSSFTHRSHSHVAPTRHRPLTVLTPHSKVCQLATWPCHKEACKAQAKEREEKTRPWFCDVSTSCDTAAALYGL